MAMMKARVRVWCLAWFVTACLYSAPVTSTVFSVKNYGAAGDGTTIDTPAINRAIEAAAASGGGTVFVPAGTYLCYSIRLKSNVCLYLDQGAAILGRGSRRGRRPLRPSGAKRVGDVEDFSANDSRPIPDTPMLSVKTKDF
jgi:hypothetical protein